MTMPFAYQHAQRDFERFLLDAREAAGLATTNQAYTMAQGVLQAFRRRLSPADAMRFAAVLPPLLRALFIDGWDPGEPTRPFEDLVNVAAEVRALRQAHNFAPATALHDVAVALRKNVDEAALERVLAALPEGARAFWRA
jgi:uncharacterized protein (DUF2267 family)